MEHRLGRTLRVFLIALSAAGFYRLAIVVGDLIRLAQPLVDPHAHFASVIVEYLDDGGRLEERIARHG